jgi:hypothetical protein
MVHPHNSNPRPANAAALLKQEDAATSAAGALDAVLLSLTNGHFSAETVMRPPSMSCGEVAMAVQSARTRAVSDVA